LQFQPTRSLVGTAGLLAALDQATQALRLGGAAERLRELYDCPIPPSTLPLIERRFARARAALDAEAADAAWQAGRALRAEDAIAEARAVLEGAGQLPRARTRSGRASQPFRLTSRELEVLRLLAGGKPNRAIAAELVLSTRTVARHLESIYAKLGVTSRTAAAGLALRSGLL
jgi:DNA-binding CsgD family transcriptional regulator